MEEIQVGEFVRTKIGYIIKLIKIDKCIITVGHGMQEIKLYAKFSNSHVINANNYQELYKEINKYIIKHSENIMDLIEVRDILKVYIRDDKKYTMYVPIENQKQLDIIKKDLNVNMLKEVLTHQQFNISAYKVGE